MCWVQVGILCHHSPFPTPSVTPLDMTKYFFQACSEKKKKKMTSDFVVDLLLLVKIQTCIALASSLSLITPAYNFPLFLFGLFAVQAPPNDQYGPLTQFTTLTAASIIIDVIWFSLNAPAQSGSAVFAIIISIVGLVLKPVTLLRLLQTLRNYGGNAGYSSAGIINSNASPLINNNQGVEGGGSSYQQI